MAKDSVHLMSGTHPQSCIDPHVQSRDLWFNDDRIRRLRAPPTYTLGTPFLQVFLIILITGHRHICDYRNVNHEMPLCHDTNPIWSLSAEDSTTLHNLASQLPTLLVFASQPLVTISPVGWCCFIHSVIHLLVSQVKMKSTKIRTIKKARTYT